MSCRHPHRSWMRISLTDKYRLVTLKWALSHTTMWTPKVAIIDYNCHHMWFIQSTTQSSILQLFRDSLVVEDSLEEAFSIWMLGISDRKLWSWKDRLKVQFQKILDLGFTDLDRDLALFAIRAYARRNFIAHEGMFDLDQSKDFAGLANYVDIDKISSRIFSRMKRCLWSNIGENCWRTIGVRISGRLMMVNGNDKNLLSLRLRVRHH